MVDSIREDSPPARPWAALPLVLSALGLAIRSLALTPPVVLYGGEQTEQPLPHFTRPTISLDSD